VVYVYFDGASKGNPGPIYVSYVITRNHSEVLAKEKRMLGSGTNNEAEWLALLLALSKALELGLDNKKERIIVRGDSELVVKQLKNQYSAHKFQQAKDAAKTLLKALGDPLIEWVPREKNLAGRGL